MFEGLLNVVNKFGGIQRHLRLSLNLFYLIHYVEVLGQVFSRGTVGWSRSQSFLYRFEVVLLSERDKMWLLKSPQCLWFFLCSIYLLGASILSVLWAFSSSHMSSALLPTRPAVQHCEYCLGRNFSFDYHMIHSLAVIPAYVIRVLLPRPQSSHKSSTLLTFVLFLL